MTTAQVMYWASPASNNHNKLSSLEMVCNLAELCVGDGGHWVKAIGLSADHLGREVGQSHHSQHITTTDVNQRRKKS